MIGSGWASAALERHALIVLSGVLSVSAAPTAPRPTARVRTESCAEAGTCVVIEAADAGVRTAASPSQGGRVVLYGIDGKNVLWQPTDDGSGSPPGGGYQVDVGPEMRLIPPHPVLWSQAYSWRQMGSGSIALVSEPCPVLGVRLEREMTLDPATGALSVLQRMRNVSQKEQAYCLWDRTLCKAGGFAILPLSAHSRFAARWVIGRRNGQAWDYDGATPEHANVKVIDGVLISHSIGPEQKIGADSDAGWIAYAWDRVLFVKYFPFDPHGSYTDGGLSVAHYFNDRVAELEPISPEARLSPGRDYVFPEVWTLRRLDAPVETHEQARALVASIPPSPLRARAGVASGTALGENARAQ
jgi:hypothetical protein